jgi:hypothetical protein
MDKPPADIRLTRQQRRILNYVRENPGCSASDVAAGIGCRPYWSAQQLRTLRMFRWVQEDESNPGSWHYAA